MKKVAAIFILLSVFLYEVLPLVPSIAQAQSPQAGINLTVSPVFVSLVTDPGKEVTSQVRIRNNSNESESLRIRLATFETGPDGAPVLRTPSKDDQFTKWVSFSDQEFDLTPNESKTVRVTINPPKDAVLGYYYAVVFERQDQQTGGGSQAVIAGAPAIPLLLEVKSPNAKRELQMVDFKTDKLFYEYLPTNFTVTIKNTGNIHAVPVGNIFVDSSFREDISVLPVNSGFGNILPNGTRSFAASWDDGFAVRSDNKTNYDLSKADKFRIGKYKANVLMIYDNGERDIPIEASVSFWVIPWKILSVILVISLFAFLGIKNSISSTFSKVRKK